MKKRKHPSTFQMRKSGNTYFSYALLKTNDLAYRMYLYKKISFFFCKKDKFSLDSHDKDVINKLCDSGVNSGRDPLVWIAAVFYAVLKYRRQFRISRKKFSADYGVNRDYLILVAKKIAKDDVTNNFNIH